MLEALFPIYVVRFRASHSCFATPTMKVSLFAQSEYTQKSDPETSAFDDPKAPSRQYSAQNQTTLAIRFLKLKNGMVS